MSNAPTEHAMTSGGASPAPQPAPAPQGAVSAGRGVVYITAAKLYFMVVGFVIEIVLPRLFGANLFGAYTFVNSSVSVVNGVAVTGTIQAVSRYTSKDPSRADVVKAAGLRLHLFVGLPVAILFALLSPVFARAAHDPGKTGPLALSACIIAGYAFYAVLVGSANGTRAFHKQAGLDMTFATLRGTALIGAGTMGLGLYGVIGGWVAAVAAILVFAAIWVGMPARGAFSQVSQGEVRQMTYFLGGVAAYLVLLNLIMQVDGFLLKRLATEAFVAHGQSPADAAHHADGQLGYYRAVQNLARLPYQLLLAVTFIVFPLVSRSTFDADHDKTRGYIRTTLRYSLVGAAAMGSVFAANPFEMLRVLYPQEFAAAGGPALAALAIGNVAFAIFTIAGTIANGAGRTRDTVAIAAFTLAAATLALWLTVPRFEPGQPMLLACGAATGGAMLLGALASGVVLWRRFGAFLPISTVVRVVAASAIAIGVGRVVHLQGKVMALAEAAAVGLVFVAVLVVTRELVPTELLGLVRRRKA